MKKTSPSEMRCQIIHQRTLSELGLISLYEVSFNNGKYAVIRLDNDQTFQAGDIFKCINNLWYCDEKLIHPMSFQYVDQAEAQRSFWEYER
ncbi:MAG TPA: hypothetical protein DEO73_07415 [Pantoea sp.]|nr:hypothetical protein [Pantoea sp.]